MDPLMAPLLLVRSESTLEDMVNDQKIRLVQKKTLVGSIRLEGPEKKTPEGSIWLEGPERT